MRRELVGAVLLLLMAATPLVSAVDGDQPEAPIDPAKLQKDMSQAQVRRLLGPPQRVARQILYRRYLEQWVYDGPHAVRIEFDCVRGKEPQILTVHPLTPARP